MNEKIPGPLMPDTDFEPFVMDAAFRLSPEAENEYWTRQARAAIHREVLTAEGVDAPVPSAMTKGASINSGTYTGWYPYHDCGSVANDAVSADCGTAFYELIWMNCGGA